MTGIGGNIICGVLFPFFSVPDLFVLRKTCKFFYDKTTNVLRVRAQTDFGTDDWRIYARVTYMARRMENNKKKKKTKKYALADKRTPWEKAVDMTVSDMRYGAKEGVPASQTLFTFDTLRAQNTDLFHMKNDAHRIRAKFLHPTLLGWNGKFVTYDDVPITTHMMEWEMATVCRYVHQGFALKDPVTIEEVPAILERYSQSEHFERAKAKDKGKNKKKRTRQ